MEQTLIELSRMGELKNYFQASFANSIHSWSAHKGLSYAYYNCSRLPFDEPSPLPMVEC